MTAYILTAEAEADLRGIIRYTRREWGAAQVRRYIAKLEQGIARLAAGEGPFKDMSELFPALRTPLRFLPAACGRTRVGRGDPA